MTIPTEEIKSEVRDTERRAQKRRIHKGNTFSVRAAQDADAAECGHLQSDADLSDEKAISRIGVLMARAPLHAKPIAAAEKKVAEAEEAKEAAWRAVKHLVVHCWTAEYERRKTEAITMLDGLFASQNCPLWKLTS